MAASGLRLPDDHLVPPDPMTRVPGRSRSGSAYGMGKFDQRRLLLIPSAGVRARLSVEFPVVGRHRHLSGSFEMNATFSDEPGHRLRSSWSATKPVDLVFEQVSAEAGSVPTIS
jgi:hypothetical protein